MKLVLQGPLRPEWVKDISKLVHAQSIQTQASYVAKLFGVNDDSALRASVADRCQQAGVDFAFVPDVHRLSDFRLIAMDMDSTLITIECIDEIADLAGLKKEVSAITEAAMRGEISDFSESLRRRVALLKGLEANALERVYAERLRLSPGAETVLHAMRTKGLRTLLVSGGFTFFTQKLQERLRLDFSRANMLDIEDGVLTGEVAPPIIDAEGKRQAVLETCAAIGCQPHEAIVVGDGANDLSMMSIAGISVAYRAKPVVRAQTTYALNVCGLDGILHWFDDTH